MRSVVVLATAAMLTAKSLLACSLLPLNPNDLVTNEPVYSANGRFFAVVRWHDRLPDFTSQLASAYYPDESQPDFEESDPVPRPTTVVAAVYATAGRRRIAELTLDRDHMTRVLVSDSGRYLIALNEAYGSMCDGRLEPTDPWVTIYGVDGMIRTVTLSDVFDPSDADATVRRPLKQMAKPDWTLRHDSDTREVAVMHVEWRREGKEPVALERRIDLATATVLDAKAVVFPAPRVFVTADDDAPRHCCSPAPPECAAAFDDPNLVPLSSQEFLRQASHAALPEFPRVANLGRIYGGVPVEAVVSAGGRVVCTRMLSLPFGLGPAADEAIHRWQFHPLTVDGKPRPFVGRVVFHFELVDATTYDDAMRAAPPE